MLFAGITEFFYNLIFYRYGITAYIPSQILRKKFRKLHFREQHKLCSLFCCFCNRMQTFFHIQVHHSCFFF